MLIFVKRAKIFMLREGAKHYREAVPMRPTAQEVPDWVRRSPDFAAGIEDGSIADLTPPVALQPTPVPEVKDDEQKEDEQKDDEQKEDEQKEDKTLEAKVPAPRKPKGSITASVRKQ